LLVAARVTVLLSIAVASIVGLASTPIAVILYLCRLQLASAAIGLASVRFAAVGLWVGAVALRLAVAYVSVAAIVLHFMCLENFLSEGRRLLVDLIVERHRHLHVGGAALFLALATRLSVCALLTRGGRRVVSSCWRSSVGLGIALRHLLFALNLNLSLTDLLGDSEGGLLDGCFY